MENENLELTTKEEIVLTALTGLPRYALEIVRAVEKSGAKPITPNNLYPVLKRLEKRGLVSSYWGDESPSELTGARRRYYKIEGSGYRALQHKSETLEKIARYGFA